MTMNPPPPPPPPRENQKRGRMDIARPFPTVTGGRGSHRDK
jgi:hypothetical protein